MLHVFSHVWILDFVQIYKIMYVGCENGIGIWLELFAFSRKRATEKFDFIVLKICLFISVGLSLESRAFCMLSSCSTTLQLCICNFYMVIAEN